MPGFQRNVLPPSSRLKSTNQKADYGRSLARLKDVVPSQVKPFLRTKRIAGIGKQSLINYITGDVLTLTAEGLDMFRLGAIATRGLWEGASTKIPEKIKSVGFVSGARQCYEQKMSATTNNFFFVKKEWPEKARNNIRLLSFEPGPNPNIIFATGPVQTSNCYWREDDPSGNLSFAKRTSV
jgi:hypothetical protein